MAGSRPPVQVAISAPRRFPGIRRRRLGSLICEAARQLGVESGEISIRLADDREMTDLHRRYKGIDAPTDVLTFDLSADVRSKHQLRSEIDVEIIVGIDVAAREARDRGLSVEIEVLRYAVHGLLHCLGEDDHDASSARRMHRREDAVLSALGFAAVFHSRRRGSATTMMQRRQSR